VTQLWGCRWSLINGCEPGACDKRPAPDGAHTALACARRRHPRRMALRRQRQCRTSRPPRGYLETGCRISVRPDSVQVLGETLSVAAAHRCHWCGSLMACVLVGHRARRGSKGVCSARSSSALPAFTSLGERGGKGRWASSSGWTRTSARPRSRSLTRPVGCCRCDGSPRTRPATRRCLRQVEPTVTWASGCGPSRAATASADRSRTGW
jgi:hypothetical protein